MQVDTGAMAGYRDDDEVDAVVVGAGAGGSILAQRLARHGWRIVVLESGPYWDPDRDGVSDEAGQNKIRHRRLRRLAAGPHGVGQRRASRATAAPTAKASAPAPALATVFRCRLSQSWALELFAWPSNAPCEPWSRSPSSGAKR